MKIVVFSCKTGGGHNACANYIKEEFEKYNVTCDVVDYFVCNKMMFVIGRYLGMVEISKIAQAFQSEEIKKVFGVVASKIQGELQKCGNK